MHVSLRNGPDIPLEALELALSLEARGFRFLAHGNGLLRLVAVSGAELTDSDRANVRKWKTHLLVLVAYDPDAATYRPAKSVPSHSKSATNERNAEIASIGATSATRQS